MLATKASFIKSGFLYSIGIFGSKVVLFLLVPVYSFFLTKSELGLYDLILVSTTLLTPLITLQLADGVYRFLLEETTQKEKKKIISTGLTGIILGNLVFLIVFSFLSPILEFNFFWEFIVLQFSSTLFIYFQQVSRALTWNKGYAYLGLGNAVLFTIISVGGLFYFDFRISEIILALSISQFFSTVIFLILSQGYRMLNVFYLNKQILLNLLKYSWPLLPNAISWWLIDLGNRFIILIYLNEAYNGIYAVSARLAGIIALINSVFILSWQDYAISKLKNDTDLINQGSVIFKKYLTLELTAVTFLTSISNYIVRFTTNNEYAEAANYLPLLLFSAALSAFCAFFGALYLRDKNTVGVFTTTLGGGLVNIILSILLIKPIGLFGVAIGSIFGFLTTLVIRYSIFKIRLDVFRIIVFLFFYGLVLLVQYYRDIFLINVFILISGIIFFFFNYKLVDIGFLKKVLNK